MLFPLILATANPLFTDTFTADPAPIVDKNDLAGVPVI